MPLTLKYRFKRTGNVLEMGLQGRNYFPSKRGACVAYSTFARKRLKNLLHGLPFEMKDFLTLTYNSEINAKEAKKHLNTFFTTMRKLYPGIKYVWAQEFQGNGRIHFHILVDITLPVHLEMVGSDWELLLQNNLWPYGLAVVEHVDYCGGLARYLVDDVSKENQRQGHYYVGRWWGNSRGIVPRANWLVNQDMADCCKGCGVGNPLYKWRGNLGSKNTFMKFQKKIIELENNLDIPF
jgi:hypothetical protein